MQPYDHRKTMHTSPMQSGSKDHLFTSQKYLVRNKTIVSRIFGAVVDYSNVLIMNLHNNIELIDKAFQESVSLKSEDKITDAVLYFNKSVQDAAWSSTPPLPSRNQDNHVAKNIFDKIITKRRIRKRWQTTRDPIAKKQLNHANRQLKRTLEKDRNDSFHNYLTSLDATASSDYSLWKATRRLKRPVNVSPPIRKSDGTWARTDQEKAGTFSEHLSH
ncbi:hypothetical protein SFRURICE_012829, partial [Spodoptera frugiperda]